MLAAFDYARVSMSRELDAEALHRLVQAAARGHDEAIRRLLCELLPSLCGLIAAAVGDCPALDGEEAVRERDAILGDVTVRVISQAFLDAWSRGAPSHAWRFVEDRSRELGGRLVDHAWVMRVVERRDPRAQELLFIRLRRLFARAARMRKLTPANVEDGFQSFSLWLLEDGQRSLRRWTPEGGRSFDGWFFARALNQIDSGRQRRHDWPDEGEVEPATGSPEPVVLARRHLERIEGWLDRRCSPHQREVFRRWFVLEESAAEIAAALEMNPPAVHMTISRLRKALAVAFDV